MESDARQIVNGEFARCIRHGTLASVADTCSFARAERVIGREYHGRFLIELLQNAADASRRPGQRSRVEVVLSEAPALLVANRGAPLTAEVVVGSLGQIGASPKEKGEAIGHKGIGFKSVLELSSNPEIYARRQQSGPFELQVAYDPRTALHEIRVASRDGYGAGRWDPWVAELADFRPGEDPLSRIPILRFPRWKDELPDDVTALAESSGGPNTVIRLPWDSELMRSLPGGRDAWLAKVDVAIRELTDEIVLLLGTFDEIDVRAEAIGATTVITRRELEVSVSAAGPTTHLAMDVEVVAVDRDGATNSQWALFRRTLDGDNLGAEIAVGVRLQSSDAYRYTVADAASEPGRSPFHLFFPTHIPTGLPFLLHGYFEVDASRTGFYRGSAPHNQAVLRGLAGLVADAVGALAARGDVDIAPLARLLQAAAEPADDLARDFRGSVLDLLDGIPWVPTAGAGTVEIPARVAPLEILASADPRVHEPLAASFPPSYVRARSGRCLPDPGVGDAGRAYLAFRNGDNEALWPALEQLLRPGEQHPWLPGTEDEGFVRVVDLLDALSALDRTQCDALTSALRDDPTATIVPVVHADGTRRLVCPPPVPSPGGPRTRMVMARIGRGRGDELSPPRSLDIDFLAEERLTAAQVAGPASVLGVREYSVDTVLDRLSGLDAQGGEAVELLRFLWRFLAREHLNQLGLSTVLRAGDALEAGQWFWWQPGAARASEAARPALARLTALQHVRLPTAAGAWAPACHLTFGAAWADWLDGVRGDAARHRIEAYRDLDKIAPGPEHLVADPETLADLLGATLVVGAGDDETGVGASGTVVDPGSAVALHAFALRLGVWEVVPVEAFVNREMRAEADRIAWPEQRSEHFTAIGWDDGLALEGKAHDPAMVHVAEDFRPRWPLAGGGDALVRSLERALPLLRHMERLVAFCPGCTEGKHWRKNRCWTTDQERYPSLLAILVRRQTWLPTRRGAVAEESAPADAWWEPTAPEPAQMRQSQFQFLRLAPPTLSVELRSWLGIPSLDTADGPAAERLLRQLRDEYVPAVHGTGPARIAFVNLHRRLYERLVRDDAVAARAVVDEIGVLAERGDEPPAHRSRAEARHDNGKFARFRHHFVGEVPFVALGRDQGTVAGAAEDTGKVSGLGIDPFEVVVEPRTKGNREPCPEAAEFTTALTNEFLALLVHHSLGSDTLQLDSLVFRERARLLASLEVFRVDDLELAISVPGLAAGRVVGTGTTREVHLDSRSRPPHILHDFSGPEWREDLRSRIHEPLAVLAGNPAFADTFALLIRAEPAAHAEFLLERGVGDAELAAVRRYTGLVDDATHRREARWWSAVLGARGAPAPAPGSDLEDALLGAGFGRPAARRLVELGGDDDVRSDAAPGGALDVLDGARVDLGRVHQLLRDAGERPGLHPGVAHRRLGEWRNTHFRHVAWLLVRRRAVTEDQAGVVGRAWTVPDDCVPQVRPDPVAVIRAVIMDLTGAGYQPDSERLADISGAREELARLAGVDVDELDREMSRLFSGDARDEILRGHASGWRSVVRLVLTAARTTANRSPTTIVHVAQAVESQLPDATVPSELKPALEELRAAHAELAARIAGRLEDRVTATVMTENEMTEAWDRASGHPGHLSYVIGVLTPRASAATTDLRVRLAMLDDLGLELVIPPGAPKPKPKPKDGKRKVGERKFVDSPKKKQTGDIGEAWAVAQVTRQLRALGDGPAGAEGRATAIEGMLALLGELPSSRAGAKAAALGRAVRDDSADPEAFLAGLSAFVHVSNISDGFGFDVLGWLASPGENPRPMFLEVKGQQRRVFELPHQFGGMGASDRVRRSIRGPRRPVTSRDWVAIALRPSRRPGPLAPGKKTSPRRRRLHRPVRRSPSHRTRPQQLKLQAILAELGARTA